jgi:APA family basic amino acid/polyamine antiporter
MILGPVILIGAFVAVWFLVPEFYTGLFDFTPTADMTWTRVFLEKIPYFVFIPFTLLMMTLCVVKRLSLIPVLGVMCCTYLMTSLGWTNWFRFAIWLIVGLVVYFFYSYTHSKLHRAETAGEA